MLKLTAKLIGIYKANDFTREDNSKVEGKTKLQLLTNRVMQDKSIKQELLDISIPNEKVSQYQDKIGKEVTVDVGVIGKVTYYGI